MEERALFPEYDYQKMHLEADAEVKGLQHKKGSEQAQESSKEFIERMDNVRKNKNYKDASVEDIMRLYVERGIQECRDIVPYFKPIPNITPKGKGDLATGVINKTYLFTTIFLGVFLAGKVFINMPQMTNEVECVFPKSEKSTIPNKALETSVKEQNSNNLKTNSVPTLGFWEQWEQTAQCLKKLQVPPLASPRP